MNKKCIGIFDSGIGGLTVLEEIKRLLPNENYIYYADSKNNPYGEKSDEELKIICSNIVDYLINNECKIIVIACNTATTRCIKYLREKYKNIIFIGTEPAIKVACDKDAKNILVMATQATVESKRTEELIINNKNDKQNIYLVACEGLAHAIEIDDRDKINNIISNIYEKYKDYDIDGIVLGCTHYPLIKDEIVRYFKDVKLFDSSLGVAKELKRQLELNNLINDNGKGDVTLINSKEL